MDRSHNVIPRKLHALLSTAAARLLVDTRWRATGPLDGWRIPSPAYFLHARGLRSDFRALWRGGTTILKGLLLVVTAMMASYAHCSAQTLEPSVQGPWAYTKRFDELLHGTEHMAATPAAEDEDTWLLLACGANHRFMAALMHVGPFPYSLSSPFTIALRSNKFPQTTLSARTAQPNQIAVDPEAVRSLMPLLIEADSLAASIGETSGATHHYTFSLQPNDMALRAIRLQCFDHEQYRD